MARAACDFFRRRHAVAAGRLDILAGETPTHRRHVDEIAERVFGHAERLEPREHRLAGGPRERSAERTFVNTGSLSYQHDRRHHRRTGHHRWLHIRTVAT